LELSAYQASIQCARSQILELQILTTISCATFRNLNLCAHEVQILNLIPTQLTLNLHKLKDSNLYVYKVQILKLMLSKLVPCVHTFWIPNICTYNIRKMPFYFVLLCILCSTFQLSRIELSFYTLQSTGKCYKVLESW
jgi:hypothetical protein